MVETHRCASENGIHIFNGRDAPLCVSTQFANHFSATKIGFPSISTNRAENPLIAISS